MALVRPLTPAPSTAILVITGVLAPDLTSTSLDLGDLYELTEKLNGGGPAADWQETLTGMAENKVQGPHRCHAAE
jgi:hypothetical protein